MKNSVIIIDFGSQVTQLIARRVREAGVYGIIVPPSCSMEDITRHRPKAIILSGGPASVANSDLSPPPQLFESDIPILGICYGMQLMVTMLGGTVTPARHREYGAAPLTVTDSCLLTQDIWHKHDTPTVWMSHGDSVTTLPHGFRDIAQSGNHHHIAIANDEKKRYGLQFHPEVTHTEHGTQLLHRFIFAIAQCEKNWSMNDYQDQTIRSIRDCVGNQKVLVALSGGVDSAVMSLLIHKAIGKQMIPIAIDTGLLRHDDVTHIENFATRHLGVPVTIHDASSQFIRALRGATDGEQKRKIIGTCFIDAFERVTRKAMPPFLAQGTLYPDVIESHSAHGAPSATIKSHHNVGGLPDHMKFQLIEPLRALFKDEVRALGATLGMEKRFLERHPFPGPGLAIRIAGEVTPDRLAVVRHADRIYRDQLDKAELTDKIWQALAILLPVTSVGVMGDGRTEGMTIVLRAVTSQDGMTADSFPFSHEFLTQCATAIINNVANVTRVLYDVTSKPPATIEWE